MNISNSRRKPDKIAVVPTKAGIQKKTHGVFSNKRQHDEKKLPIAVKTLIRKNTYIIRKFKFTENYWMNIPLSLYIHLPWCLQKCPYCDFNSHALRQTLPETAYIQALLADFDQGFPSVQGRLLSSIFFGGGTPSLFSPQSIAEILAYVEKKMPFKQSIEITLEANPGTFEQKKFADFKSAGVNRLSIGVQSFQDTKLEKLGRIHGAKQAITAVEMAYRVGFENINIDLMYGLPEQSIPDAIFDLETACRLAPTHISWYQLTLEPNTLYAAKPPPLPEDDAIWDMQETGQLLLAQAGFTQYEVSAYARSEKPCQHNLNYWKFGDYLGIGAGAHSKLTTPDPFTVTRFWKHKNPRQYLDAAPSFIAEQKNVKREQLPFEFMLNALRLKGPTSIDLFTKRTGLICSEIVPKLEKAAARKLLIWDENQIALTPLGWEFMNDVLEIFG
jgi:putative oxygen-independent coproporphyrinogen III oxidase